MTTESEPPPETGQQTINVYGGIAPVAGPGARQINIFRHYGQVGAWGLAVLCAAGALTAPLYAQSLVRYSIMVVGGGLAVLFLVTGFRSGPSKSTNMDGKSGAPDPGRLREPARQLAMAVRTKELDGRSVLLYKGPSELPADLTFTPVENENILISQPVGSKLPPGSLREVASYYQALSPRRLVILGEPGAGKTVLATELIIQILEAGLAHQDWPAGPNAVPIRFNLANWTGGDLSGFLAEQLHLQYQLPRDDAECLAISGMILPVLDGLDEMESEPGDPLNRAQWAVDRINDYHRAHPDTAGLVLTCRDTAYGDLDRPILDAAVVRMHALTVDQITEFVSERLAGDGEEQRRWLPVLTSLRAEPAGTAYDLLRTPWRLTLALTAAADVDALDPASLLGETAGRFEAKLLDAFPTAMLNRRREEQKIVRPGQPDSSGSSFTVPDEQTLRHWLRVLARYSNSSLALHTMWAIAGQYLVRFVHLVIHLACALAFLVSCLFAIIGGAGHGGQAVGALWSGSVRLTEQQKAAMVWLAGAGVVLIVWAVWLAITPAPRRSKTKSANHRSRAMRQMTGKQRIAAIAEISLAIGSALGLLAWLVGGWIAGTVVGVLVAIFFGLAMDKVRLDKGLSGGTDLQRAWRHDLLLALLGAVLVGTVFPFFLGYSLWAGVVMGAIMGFAGAFVLSLQAWLRYVIAMTIMKFRGDLPWRLGAFLDWAYLAGLMRISGIGYQFRHRQLREWFARNGPAQDDRSSVAAAR
ncbi:NACHT domain-containing protein [Micromonospora sp. NPDC049903]|uniref:NACHT domain-containing protein n=1 Tax=Micromonospora sp. NPDC049903 TaxID=3364276 RepID=UPI0037B1501D